MVGNWFRFLENISLVRVWVNPFIFRLKAWDSGPDWSAILFFVIFYLCSSAKNHDRRMFYPSPRDLFVTVILKLRFLEDCCLREELQKRFVVWPKGGIRVSLKWFPFCLKTLREWYLPLCFCPSALWTL